MKFIFALLIALTFSACSTTPTAVEPIIEKGSESNARISGGQVCGYCGVSCDVHGATCSSRQAL